MAKPQNKNSREPKQSRPFNNPRQESRPNRKVEEDIAFRRDSDRPISGGFLIVCEGETEYSYFEGLCHTFNLKNNFRVVVLPEKRDLDGGYMGSSAKGLLYEAMKRQKNEKVGYDEIWIVCDNDENNAYILDPESLARIKKVAPNDLVFKALEKKKSMEVRDKDRSKGEGERARYFLSYFEYKNFLINEILADSEASYAEIIIDQTTKKNELERLFEAGQRRQFFYDDSGAFLNKNDKSELKFNEKNFDQKLLDSIKVAYTCISFEYFILLHFKKSSDSFYNSREILHYFDEKKYFDCPFKKGEKNGFAKGFHLYDLLKSGNNIVKNFFKKAKVAIFNNVLLQNEMYAKPEGSRKFYEVNPYSDAYKLSAGLLNMDIAVVGIPKSYRNLIDIVVSRNRVSIHISFVYGRKKRILKKEIEAFFSIVDAQDNTVPIAPIIDSSIGNPVEEGDNVTIKIPLNQTGSTNYFLFLKETEKSVNYCLVWAI